jgi:hypothetical protein
MSPREEVGVFNTTDEVEGYCNKSPKDRWLSQVNSKWDLYMLQQAHNWEAQDLPEEVLLKLSNTPVAGDESSEKTWMSLINMKSGEQ